MARSAASRREAPSMASVKSSLGRRPVAQDAAGRRATRLADAYFLSERMYLMTAQRSFSGRCFHGGIGPRPLEIFQNSSPSVSFWTWPAVQSAGLGLSATAAAPSPFPFSPWQEAQLILAIFLPCSMTFLSLGSGFIFAFSDADAVQCSWAS